jgi:hypothetical protein
MTKAVFMAYQDKYIASVAKTADVIQENVKILSIDEFSTESLRIITARSLLAISVSVQTSVLIVIGHQSNIKDQSMLNSNLNENGLPSGTLTVHSSHTSVGNVTTPGPWPGGTEAATAPGSAASSNISIGYIVGGIVGFSVLVGLIFLALRSRKNKLVSAQRPIENGSMYVRISFCTV